MIQNFTFIYLMVGFLFYGVECYGQNLIPNPSFEVKQSGGANPQCEYSFNHYNQFDADIEDWRIADHNNNDAFTVINAPDWIDKTLCDITFPALYNHCPVINHLTDLSSNRFVHIECQYQKFPKKKKKYHEAIRAGLLQTLVSNKIYILKFKYKTIQLPVGNIYSGMNNLRIHFSKWGEHWNSNSSNNQKWNDAANISFQQTYSNVSCEWKIYQKILDPVPFDNLSNIIFYVEEGAFTIDDVELYEVCPDDLMIENKIYNIPEPTIKAGSLISANNVVINENANISYQAGVKIILTNFHSKGYFHAYIAPCDINSKSDFVEDSIILNDLDLGNDSFNYDININIYPNPNNGLFLIQLRLLNQFANCKVEIFNMLGEMLLSKNIETQTQEFDLSEQPKGVYLAKVYIGETVFNHKIVIQ